VHSIVGERRGHRVRWCSSSRRQCPPTVPHCSPRVREEHKKFECSPIGRSSSLHGKWRADSSVASSGIYSCRGTDSFVLFRVRAALTIWPALSEGEDLKSAAGPGAPSDRRRTRLWPYRAPDGPPWPPRPDRAVAARCSAPGGCRTHRSVLRWPMRPASVLTGPLGRRSGRTFAHSLLLLLAVRANPLSALFLRSSVFSASFFLPLFSPCLPCFFPIPYFFYLFAG